MIYHGLLVGGRKAFLIPTCKTFCSSNLITHLTIRVFHSIRGIRLKVLSFSSIRFPGYFGDAVRLPNLGRCLTRKGWEFHMIISGAHVDTDSDELVNGLHVHRFAIPSHLRPLFKVRKLWAILGEVFTNYLAAKGLSIIRGEDVDLLLGYMPNCWGGYPAAQCKILTGLPMVLDCADLFKRYPSILQHLTIRTSDKILVISQPIKDFLMFKFAVPEKKIVVLPNGVDTSLFNPWVQGKGLKEELNVEHIVLFAGYLFTLDVLIKSALNIVKEKPKTLFLIIGNHNRSFWVSEVKKFGLEKNFLFAGPKPHSEIPKYIMESDVCVNIFSQKDYFAAAHPLKILEYMACGKPVVATNLPGTAQTIQNGVNGFLYNPDDVETFTECLNTLLSDPNLRRRMGQAAWNTVKEKYRWETITENFTKALENVFSGRD